ncbi:carbon-nitrogen hydrolase family protein [Alkalilimnicola ehrlichii]
MVSGAVLEENLEAAARLIAQAAEAGADWVLLPENFALMGPLETDKLAIAERDGEGPIQRFLAEAAARHKLWLIGGTIPLRGSDPQRVRAACLVYDAAGQRVARYDKIHLFDVEIGAEERYCESATLEPGAQPVVVETPLGGLGLTVCYDLRFPELFRHMIGQGMEIAVVPAAFTAVTGEAHWQTLLRARAIENQCYVVAAGQGGRHPNGRETHGESMIVDPWGVVLSSVDKGEGFAIAEFSRARLETVRRRFPALSHRRF